MIMPYIKQQFANLKSFIAKPDDNQTDLSAANKCGFFFFILVLDVVIAGMLTFALELLLKFIPIDIESNFINLLMKSSPPGFVILIAVIIAPLIEEFIFRFFLRYNKMFPLLIYRSIKFKRGMSKDNATKDVRMIWDRYFHFVFYFPLFLFSLFHIFNYQLTPTVIIMMPLLVLPQLLSGLFFGYIRVRLNYLSAVLMHTLHNLIFVGIVILQIYSTGYYDKAQTGKIHKIETENYKMVIEEIQYSPSDESEFHVYPGLMKFRAINASIEALNTSFVEYLSKDSTLDDNKTYELLENDVMNRINNKKFNIDYNSKREYEHHLDTIVSVINKMIGSGVGRKTKFERTKVF